ncbi:hypothetical protein QR680_004305 [Steinernema hermaphroditum]|uniref:Uncharacterized protein n=1 Tax=Steinernema hermaphroditum TaxID=289476 RepID=A0AA39LTS2_9BILA|nr:hypothetical protein QR680_004305 [Steinernema hermaphroditum]
MTSTQFKMVVARDSGSTLQATFYAHHRKENFKIVQSCGRERTAYPSRRITKLAYTVAGSEVSRIGHFKDTSVRQFQGHLTRFLKNTRAKADVNLLDVKRVYAESDLSPLIAKFRLPVTSLNCSEVVGHSEDLEKLLERQGKNIYLRRICLNGTELAPRCIDLMVEMLKKLKIETFEMTTCSHSFGVQDLLQILKHWCSEGSPLIEMVIGVPCGSRFIIDVKGLLRKEIGAFDVSDISEEKIEVKSLLHGKRVTISKSYTAAVRVEFH